MKRTAFSLVELSIVLVILGLLVGGILAGQSLIRASELRSVSTEAERHITALSAFRDKYFGYPGDIMNATSFWGVAGGNGTGNDSACRTAAALLTPEDRRTCNGSGDGMVGASGASWEVYTYWSQLNSAGLIEGALAYRATAVLGESVPRAKIDGAAGWYFGNSGTVSGSANAFDGVYGNGFNIFTRPTVRGILTGAEAWNIDTKMDDGKPGQGRVVSNWSATYSNAGVACTTASSGADAASALYQLGNSTKDCGLFWLRL